MVTIVIGTKCGKLLENVSFALSLFISLHQKFSSDENEIQNHCLSWKALSICAIKISLQNHYIFTTLILLCHEFSFYHTFFTNFYSGNLITFSRGVYDIKDETT